MRRRLLLQERRLRSDVLLFQSGMKRRPVVLVVDDESSIRTTMCAVLTLKDFLPVPADSVDAALKVLGAEHIDAMVLDVRLPDHTGIVPVRPRPSAIRQGDTRVCPHARVCAVRDAVVVLRRASRPGSRRAFFLQAAAVLRLVRLPQRPVGTPVAVVVLLARSRDTMLATQEDSYEAAGLSERGPTRGRRPHRERHRCGALHGRPGARPGALRERKKQTENHGRAAGGNQAAQSSARVHACPGFLVDQSGRGRQPDVDLSRIQSDALALST